MAEIEKVDEENTICAQCCTEIPLNEVQKCEWCGMDCLGNCCIGEFDHQCVEDEENEDG